MTAKELYEAARRKQRSAERAAAVPIDRLNLRSVQGRREFMRRIRWHTRLLPNAWSERTGAPMNKPRALRNEIGRRQRWAWVPKIR